MDNSRICHCLLFHEHGKQNFVQPFLWSRKLLRALHNEVMSWIFGTYECHYAWTLPKANATTVDNLTVTICEQPALVCHGPQSHSVDPLVWSSLVRGPLHQLAWESFSTCANLKCILLIRSFVRSFNLNFQYMATHKQTYTRVLQCSPVSVGLAQPCPSKFLK